jgi:hypothetical protein
MVEVMRRCKSRFTSSLNEGKARKITLLIFTSRHRNSYCHFTQILLACYHYRIFKLINRARVNSPCSFEIVKLSKRFRFLKLLLSINSYIV